MFATSSGPVNIASQKDFDAAWELWNDLVFTTVNAFVPKVPTRNPNHPPWIKRDLAKAIRKKKTLWRKVRNCNNPVLLEKFRKNRQSIKIWIRSARKKYLADIANEVHNDSKRFWSYFSFKNKRKPIPDKIYYGADVFSNDLARSNAFSKYFQSIYKDHIGCGDIAEENVPLDSVSESLDLIQVSVKEVTSLLQPLMLANQSDLMAYLILS